MIKETHLYLFGLLGLIGLALAFLVKNELLLAEIAITLTLIVNLVIIHYDRLRKIKALLRNSVAAFIVGLLMGMLIN